MPISFKVRHIRAWNFARNVNLVKLKVTKNQGHRLTTWENIQNQKIEGHAVPPMYCRVKFINKL